MTKLTFDVRMAQFDKMGDWMLKVDKLYKRTKLHRRKSFKAKMIPQEYFDIVGSNDQA